MTNPARLLIAAVSAMTLAHCGAGAPPENAGQRTPATVRVPEPEPENSTQEKSELSDSDAAAKRVVELPSGVTIEDHAIGSGPRVEANHRVRLHYVGSLTDGTVFDSSRERNQPFEVELGRNMLIKGFEEGIVGMRVGGTRRIVIPPELGYGSQAHAKIPANSTLIFEIELLGAE